MLVLLQNRVSELDARLDALVARLIETDCAFTRLRVEVLERQKMDTLATYYRLAS